MHIFCQSDNDGVDTAVIEVTITLSMDDLRQGMTDNLTSGILNAVSKEVMIYKNNLDHKDRI